MRVLLLTTDAYGGHGGIALYNRDVADALASLPEVDEVVVIVRTLPLAATGIPDKVRFVATAAGSKWRYVGAALAAARKPFDMVICGHIHLLPLAVLLNLKLRAPLALLVYGIDVWQCVPWLQRAGLDRVDAIWSISAITRERMNAWAKLPVSRYVLLPNAIHLERYGMAAKNPALLERHGLVGRRVIMTLARLACFERYKGIDEVLEAMPSLLREVPDLRYLVVGGGTDLARLQEKARTLGVHEQVVFTGFIDEAEKADHFRLADAFVMPGHGEGFGFVFLEALACGIPAVGSRLDGSREALREGALGELVDPEDPVSVRAGILHALQQPKAIPAGLDYFAWPQFRERLLTAVRSLTSPQRTEA